MRTRAELIDRLKAGDAPDILVIGGGINGVGVFRDLAAQGVPALLVEAGDFSSGTSAAPSRLIHGGLRYLETGEVSLVRESLVERNLLIKNACHVVHPQPIWVPLRSWFAGSVGAVARFLGLTRTPGRKGAIPVKLGLLAYDIYGRAHQTMPDHRMLSAARARAEMPVLAGDVRAVAEYYDARITHPERLVLELAADAESDCAGSMAVPYLAAGAQSGGRVSLHDHLTGETLEVTPRIVVNASGAWVDEVQNGLGFEGRLMGGTRGTHLAMRMPDLASALSGRMLYFETYDQRACLVLPLDESIVYVGTTDIRVEDPDENRYTEEEIDYIFQVLGPVLPDVAFRREDIVFAMAGVRPLPYQNVGTTGAISRGHRLDIHDATPQRPFRTFTLVGGKWTTYRAFGEEVTDALLETVGHPRRTGTETLPIGGAKGLPVDPQERARFTAALAADTGVSESRCAALVSRYGAHARTIAAAERTSNASFAAVDGYSPAEIDHICRTERVCKLEDIVLRRTLMGFEGRITADGLEEVAAVAATALGWDERRQAEELAACKALLRERHRVALEEA
jgi:glycerol-3-phosphate dehydrogenase